MASYNKIIEWYESLTKESLNQITQIYTDDAFFKDPFNEFTGVSKIRKVFDHMFEEMESPLFVFTDQVIAGDKAFLVWDFKFILKGKPYSIHGGSHLVINSDGKIIYHRDYWDTGEELLAKIPILKIIYNQLRKKLGVKE